MSKKALITGITGQDGSYLSEHLLSLGYEVFGLVRRNSVTENQESRIEKLRGIVNLSYGDLLDTSSIDKLLYKVKPDEIYNLASQSHVRVSYEIPQFTVQTNALGVVNLLESVKMHCPHAKIYQASSSEMFGNSRDADGLQRENTPMHPVSPYGCSKLFSYSLFRNYRNAFNLFASNGILFNHESPRRATNFVTTKIIKTAVQIKKGTMKKLELGNLDSQRDWGHAKDYVKAMHLILNHNKADDFIISTGETRSIRDLCKIVFSKLGMNYEDHVKTNPKFIRPEELNYLCGDSSKARKVLGWKPEYSYDLLIDEMLEHFLKLYSS
jgi:GDPmannose 4,6-dehydratase|tara:strand:- start:466 stop:1440 length:975 start_codon:yes stop_codon:yes gene_type:complete